MANSELYLLPTNPSPLSSVATSFLSSWGDKRSGTTVGISVVFYGVSAPDGYCTLEVSNAPMDRNGRGTPNNNGDDAATLASSQTNVTLNPITGLYGVQWLISDCPAHFIRVRYTASSNKSGLSANVYFNVPHESA